MREIYDPEGFRPERFVRRAPWQQVRRPFRDPHQIAIRGRGGIDPEEFDAMCAFILANGYEAEFEGTSFVYFECGDHVYWISRGVYRPRFPIINRKPIEAA